jgi:glutathione S-transferase
MAEITFHSMADSAYLWTAMHVADEKGVSYEFAPLIYGSAEHFDLHPFGKMPVLQHGDLFLYETAAIAHYIDRAFAGAPLQPPTAWAQAQVLRWISMINAYVFPVMNRFTKERLVRPAWGVAPDVEFLASAREPLKLQIRLIEEAAADGWLAGPALTIADSFLFPHLLFFGLTPEGAAMLAGAPCSRAWLRQLMERKSFLGSAMSRAYDVFHTLPTPNEFVWPVD